MKIEWHVVEKEDALFIAMLEEDGKAAIAAHGPVLWQPFKVIEPASKEESQWADAQWEIYCDRQEAEREARDSYERELRAMKTITSLIDRDLE